ncbi:prolyl oligopeptidase family serine peptidase [uncultured Cohaesibacter sp.]|uniref:alpha/beta hydrolase family protein n=1 Tax=uncultured Cohaesibacter sp. TaxID=1002546 RepID=UPI0029C6A932|nr:prolyl oligopeptidase family serine peptidase [uncultured Cohaesibacter sp.]
MSKMTWRELPLIVFAIAAAFSPAKAENRIDIVRADAPELAAYGDQKLGVRQLDFVHENQIDILNISAKDKDRTSYPRYDRPLSVEVWYPAAADAEGSTALKANLRDGETQIDLHGKAIREAEPAKLDKPLPLVIVTHGYPGNRFLMSPIAENLASKGYVVAAIDHTDATYATLGNISSTLVNRTKDDLFVLNQIDALSKDESSFLFGLVDTNNTGMIGYSMGGYGTIVTVGGGLTQKALESQEGFFSAPAGTLDQYRAGSEAYNALTDARIKTAVTFAPAGVKRGFMDAETLKGVRVPTLFIAGSIDDIVGYEDGVRKMWQLTKNVDRSLLTFENANHNAGAPMSAPAEADFVSPKLGFNLTMHYLDPVWDNVRMNNISSHFITAWMDKYLKGDASKNAYLDLVPVAHDGVWSREKDGTPKADDSYWKGFPNRTAAGLRFETLKKGE